MNVGTHYLWTGFDASVSSLLKNQAVNNTNNDTYGYEVRASDYKVKGDYNLNDGGTLDSDTAASMRQWAQDHYVPSDPDVVDNSEYARKNMFQIYSNVDASGNWVVTSNTAQNGYDRGRAIHGFSYSSADFLLDAAKEYAKLEDGQSYQWRVIHDVDFIQDAVHFFTGDYASSEELKLIQAQMDNVVKELAARIKNGESTDINSLVSTITIAGKDVTMGQLLEMRDVSKALTKSMDTITNDGSYSFAEYGMAVAMAGLYANISNNPLGKEFQAAVEHLATRAIDLTTGLWERCMPQYPHIPLNGKECAALFRDLELNSVEGAASAIRDAINQFSAINSKYGEHASETGNAARRLMEQFSSWLNLIQG